MKVLHIIKALKINRFLSKDYRNTAIIIIICVLLTLLSSAALNNSSVTSFHRIAPTNTNSVLNDIIESKIPTFKITASISAAPTTPPKPTILATAQPTPTITPLITPMPTKVPKEPVVYLTFDDGPSPDITPMLLDILKKYNVKATFFVIGSEAVKYPNLIQRISEEGHLVANHTYTHKSKIVYSNTEDFVSDTNKAEEILKGILKDKYKGKIMRFPGGSGGDKREPFKEAIVKAGYKFYDWNCLSNDMVIPNLTDAQAKENIINTMGNKTKVTILMHDARKNIVTANILPWLIEYLQAKGFSFELLS